MRVPWNRSIHDDDEWRNRNSTRRPEKFCFFCICYPIKRRSCGPFRKLTLPLSDSIADLIQHVAYLASSLDGFVRMALAIM